MWRRWRKQRKHRLEGWERHKTECVEELTNSWCQWTLFVVWEVEKWENVGEGKEGREWEVQVGCEGEAVRCGGDEKRRCAENGPLILCY